VKEGFDMMIPTLAIDWRLDANEIIVSEKDLILPIDEIAWDFKRV
jgi:dTDP-4-dehydrorhamnose 3,5-epimerase